jgi:hypothetical protein
LLTIRLRGHAGIAALSEGKVKDGDAIPEFAMLCKDGSACDLHIAAMCADGENGFL